MPLIGTLHALLSVGTDTATRLMRHHDPAYHGEAGEQQDDVDRKRPAAAGYEAIHRSLRSVRRRQGPARCSAGPRACTAIQAAFFCSICLLSFPPDGPIAIRRGFIASGISRTSSIFSRPFSNVAPCT